MHWATRSMPNKMLTYPQSMLLVYAISDVGSFGPKPSPLISTRAYYT